MARRRSPRGPARAALGLWATAGTLLDGEDDAAWAALETELQGALAPEGAVEKLLVERIVSAVWRLRRLRRIEASLYALGVLGAEMAYESGKAYLQLVEVDGEFPPPAEEGVLEGQAWLRLAAEPRALAELARWETAVERVLYRALGELESRPG